MERVGTLINKLKEQFEQQAGPEKLAVTAQLLLAELQKIPAQASLSSKISVMLPSVPGNRMVDEDEKIPEPAKDNTIKETGAGWLFDTTAEIPTLAHQERVEETVPQRAYINTPPERVFEFNTSLANHGESLNDKLKEERVEVATALQGTPIRDLKKAIGINDRFLFVNDLFRGDENMYERSIKTINAFTIYPEAEYWIQRELKVKLSWPDSSETVKLFDQLIKRRFS